ncbi:MAG: histidine kinase [Flavobacteriaceae bacterium]|jgi:signal transduction histidine kinase|nr:histidine kinase [Flavobacteriaceae bacterium]
MINKLIPYCLLFTVLFTLTYCTPEKTRIKTDVDQLYAVQYNDKHKDSLAKSINSEVKVALELSNTHHNRKIIDSTLQKLRWTYDSINFKNLSNKAIKYATDKDDKYILASTYNNLGMYYHDLYQLDSTYYYYLKTENVYKSLKDTLKLGETRFYQARLLFEMGLFAESESSVSQSLSLLYNFPNTPIHYEANQLMALCLMERKEYSEAERYLKKALDLMLKDINKNKVLDQKRATMAIIMLYGNLSELSYLQKKYPEAHNYALQGQKYITKNTHPMLVSFLKNNLAKSNFRLTKERKYIQEVIDGYKSDSVLKNNFRMHYASIDIAELYLSENQIKKANEWAKKSYNNAVIHNVIPYQITALEFLLLNDSYEMQPQVKQLIQLRQIVTAEDNQARNRFARIAYETEVIEQENDQLKDIIFIISIGGVTLVFLLIIGIYRFKLKTKSKELRLVRAQKKANDNINELIIERNLIALDVKKKERNRIAKDLHDSVVNTIFTIRFNLQLLDSTNNKNKELLIEELQKLEQNTRQLSHDLIDNELFNENKFSQLVEDLTSMQINAWKTTFKVKHDPTINFDLINAETKVNIFYILREAIQNVNKYSHAKNCIITFSGRTNGMQLTIEDNGIGFDNSHNNSNGIGLSNIKERAQQINAIVTINSYINQGTTISLFIPYPVNTRTF